MAKRLIFRGIEVGGTDDEEAELAAHRERAVLCAAKPNWILRQWRKNPVCIEGSSSKK